MSQTSTSVFVLTVFACMHFCCQAAANADEPVGSADRGLKILNDVAYRPGGGNEWTMDISMPAEAADGLRPAIVVIHGGGWIQGDKSSFSRPQVSPPGHIRNFARQGYVAATINYRLAPQSPFPAAIHDCKNAVRFLRAHAKEYGIDPNRIGAWGNSAGGHLAMVLGMVGSDAKLEGDGPYQDQSSLVQAVCSDSGPMDLVHQFRDRQVECAIIRFLAGPPEGLRLNDYRTASLNPYVREKLPPMLLIYGVDDEQVGVETADQFVVEMDRAGNKDVTYLRLANVGHCPHSIKQIPTVPPIVDHFFARTLQLKK